jgi:hypothetical protein
MTPVEPEATSNLWRFDFWVLLGIAAVAVLEEFVSAFAADLRGGHPSASALGVLTASSLVFVVLLARGASQLPPRAGFSLLPILEAWRLGSLTARDALVPVVVGMAAGILQPYAAIQYHELLKRWFGPAPFTHPAHRQSLGVVDLLCSSIIEEMMFRAALFSLLVIAIRWIWEAPISKKSIPIWIGNVLQALIFGAAHTAAGVGGIKLSPWYVSVPLSAQTWSGLVLGCIYWRYGLESAIISHTTYDLLVLQVVRFRALRRAVTAPWF